MPAPSPKVTVTNVVPTQKPAPKPVAAAANRHSELELAPADAEVQSLVQELVNQQANSDLATITTNLGEAAKDPTVKKILDNLQQKIDDGKPITTADVAALGEAVRASGLPVAPGVTPIILATNAGALTSSSQANAILAAAGSATPGLPDGFGPFVVIPTLPDETVLWLPGGSILLGTGGQGAVSVVETPVEELLGMAVATSEPIPDAAPSTSGSSSSGALLQNPIDNGGVVKFDVAGRLYTLEPDGEQRIALLRNSEIMFDRGNGNGRARYSIWDGTYTFAVTDKGWDLYRQKFSVTIDNSGNESAFNYVVDNVATVIGPGETKTHTGDFPIEIRYDRGNGEQEATKRIDKTSGEGTALAVMVNAKDGCWDLFAAAARASEVNPVAGAKSKNELAKKALSKKAGSKSARLSTILSDALRKNSEALKWTVAKQPVADETQATLLPVSSKAGNARTLKTNGKQ